MLVFFVLAFGLAWITQVPVYALHLDGGLALGLLAIGGAAPTIAAIAATRGRVWKETWRRPASWCPLLVAPLFPSAIVLIAGFIGGAREITIGIPFIPSVIWPPLGEELGWRGYLQ